MADLKNQPFLSAIKGKKLEKKPDPSTVFPGGNVRTCGLIGIFTNIILIENQTNGNENWSFKSHTKESKRKLSESKKGNTNCLGRVLSEETKQKISVANKGKIRSEDHRRNHARPMLGRLHSKETKQKMSNTRKGKILSEETKRKIGAKHKGKTISAEHRQRISEANRGQKR